MCMDHCCVSVIQHFIYSAVHPLLAPANIRSVHCLFLPFHMRLRRELFGPLPGDHPPMVVSMHALSYDKAGIRKCSPALFPTHTSPGELTANKELDYLYFPWKIILLFNIIAFRIRLRHSIKWRYS